MSRPADSTRQSILTLGMALAARVGLGGLTIGSLAQATGMSKSGLFAHFGSKEALQVKVLETATEQFIDEVVRPALRAPRGEPRVRQLFTRWMDWGLRSDGGCIFAAASFELDDQSGPARDALVKSQRDWIDALAQAARIAQAEGHFDPSLDAEDFAFDLYGIMLATHSGARLFQDPRARQRADASFERLLSRSRPTAH